MVDRGLTPLVQIVVGAWYSGRVQNTSEPHDAASSITAWRLACNVVAITSQTGGALVQP